MMNINLPLYYSQRAAHYDEIYQRPERQPELQGLCTQLTQLVQDKNVLEVACGTAYWTAHCAKHASSVLATDSNPDMLALARKKLSGQPQVQFQQADAFALPEGDYNACVAGFWWSHVKRSEQTDFLEQLQRVVGSGSTLVMFDNCYVDGDSTPIARTDAEGNTYQIRRLPDGSRHEVIKNFYTDSTLRKKLAQHARDIRVVRGHYFWMLTCVLR